MRNATKFQQPHIFLVICGQNGSIEVYFSAGEIYVSWFSPYVGLFGMGKLHFQIRCFGEIEILMMYGFIFILKAVNVRYEFSTEGSKMRGEHNIGSVVAIENE